MEKKDDENVGATRAGGVGAGVGAGADAVLAALDCKARADTRLALNELLATPADDDADDDAADDVGVAPGAAPATRAYWGP